MKNQITDWTDEIPTEDGIYLIRHNWLGAERARAVVVENGEVLLGISILRKEEITEDFRFAKINF